MLRGIGPDQTRANLDAMLAELKKREIPVLLTGMVAAPNLGSDYADKFNPIYPELASKYEVSFYPFILDDVVTDKARSEEHTSELQSLMRISYAVFCLKKKKQTTRSTNVIK